MKKVKWEPSWAESWQYSYQYDLLEIYGDTSCPGYTYPYANRRQHTLELIQKVAQPGAKVLDVAAAQGNFSLSMAELGYDVTWNDLREDLADYVKIKWERGIIRYAPGNILTIDFDGYFDIVLIAEVIEHVAHPDDFIKKIASLVKPDGHIIMSTPNGEYFLNRLPKFSDCPDPSKFENIQFQPDSDGHIFLLHLDEVESLANQAGLSVVETILSNNPLTNGHIKLGTILNLLPHTWIDAFENITHFLPWSWRNKLHSNMTILLACSAKV